MIRPLAGGRGGFFDSRRWRAVEVSTNPLRSSTGRFVGAYHACQGKMKSYRLSM